MEKTWQLYINGRWVGAQSGQTFAVVNPATQDVLAQVPDGGPAEAYAAVMTWIILRILDAAIGLRVSDEDEQMGLDLTQHNEAGYTL